MHSLLVVFMVISFGWILFGILSLIFGPVKLKGPGLSALLLIIVLAIPILDFVLVQFRFVARTPFFYRIVLISSPFAIGPLVWICSNQLHSTKVIKPFLKLVHFLPFIIHMVMAAIPSLNIIPSQILPLAGDQGPLTILEVTGNQVPNLFPPSPPEDKKTLLPLIVNYLKFVSMLIYSFLVIKSLVNRKKELGDFYSGDTHRVNLVWVYHLNISLFTLNLLALGMLSFSFILKIPELISISNVVPPAFFVLFFVYFSRLQTVPRDIEQARLESVNLLANDESSSIDSTTEKYLRSGLDSSESDKILQQAQLHIETNKLYLDEDLTLDKLASQLNLNRHHLSQAINSKTEGNFNLFVNRFRINAILDQLQQGEHKNRTLMEIALNVSVKLSLNHRF